MNLSIRRFFISSFFGWVLFAAVTSVYFYYYGKDSLKFGIDLVGGTYITLEVQESDVIKNELNDKVKSFQSSLKHGKISFEGAPVLENGELIFKFASASVARDAETLLRSEDRNLSYNVTNEGLLKITVSSNRIQKLLSDAVNANIDILGQRLDGMSVSEIHISKQGDRQIVVELPDVRDPRQAKTMIGKSAVLEFKLVEDSAASRDELLDKYDHELPEGTIIVSGRTRGMDDRMYYLVPEYTPVSGKYFKDAQVTFGGDFGTDLVVAFEFDEEGGKRFHEVTSNNIGKTLAIVLDDEIIQVANIKSAIGSRGSIMGNFQSEEASSLAKLLKSGSFKAKVNFIEEREIGPTLGQESVHNGLKSCLIGLFLLLIFGIFYYRLSGFFAVLALFYNLLLVLLFLSLIKGTLTLPGIAGMILTVGMAIDASILIYERIKECIAEGMSVSQSIKDGFSDAMYVILDANITTFIVAAVLFYFGTGPIQGFAVTMMIGIVSTLLTGLFFLKSIFALYLRISKVSKLSI